MRNLKKKRHKTLTGQNTDPSMYKRGGLHIRRCDVIEVINYWSNNFKEKNKTTQFEEVKKWVKIIQ